MENRLVNANSSKLHSMHRAHCTIFIQFQTFLRLKSSFVAMHSRAVTTCNAPTISSISTCHGTLQRKYNARGDYCASDNRQNPSTFIHRLIQKTFHLFLHLPMPSTNASNRVGDFYKLGILNGYPQHSMLQYAFQPTDSQIIGAFCRAMDPHRTKSFNISTIVTQPQFTSTNDFWAHSSYVARRCQKVALPPYGKP